MELSNLSTLAIIIIASVNGMAWGALLTCAILYFIGKNR
jgi:hypothetical protein